MESKRRKKNKKEKRKKVFGNLLGIDTWSIDLLERVEKMDIAKSFIKKRVMFFFHRI